MRFWYLLVLAVLIFTACGNKKSTEVNLKAVIKLHSVIQLEKVGFNGEKDLKIDSAEVTQLSQNIRFTINDPQPGIYKISSKNESLQVLFINDAPVINIKANFVNEKYKVSGSPGYSEIETFRKRQTKIAKQWREDAKAIDSLKHKGIFAGNVYHDLIRKNKQDSTRLFEGYISFADTVKSPALFMWTYNTVEFGDDHQKQKTFIIKAAKRFPSYKPVQDLTKQTLAVIAIYEQEYIAGNTLPAITLPDENGLPFSTSSLKGQYYLIDFWSTVCGQCMAFKKAEVGLANQSLPLNFQIVSVAVDDQKDAWKKMIGNPKKNWKNLIDEKMWQGTAVQTLKFDSIPFNFLVSPQGKVIKTAIKPDSLTAVIKALKL